MYHLRTTKTKSGATALQIVYYKDNKKYIQKHIGSAHSEEELISLKQIAYEWIEENSDQMPLFPLKNDQSSRFVDLSKVRNVGHRYTFAYDILSNLLQKFRFTELDSKILLNLVIIRIIEPTSKRESLKLLYEFFDIKHNRIQYYRSIPTILEWKEDIEKKVTKIAQKHFSFDFSIVFYDVTTLYFESFTPDELRKNGISKDYKSNQPQILVGLVVTRDGFPVSFDVFEGNTFEGNTFIPVISKFQSTHKIKTFTVVADAAMISLKNVTELSANNLSYIVGARVANLSRDMIEKISLLLAKVDGRTIRLQTKTGTLICSFSLKRYRKDKREMEKQILKAEQSIKNNKAKGMKFVKRIDKKGRVLNTTLIEKTKLLLGIKGYYTNLDQESDEVIINHYHDLWHVEKSFRIAKSDLLTRPVYHHTKEAIEAHILICFMALSICKYMELKTDKSTKQIVKLFKSITDAVVLNKVTGEKMIIPHEKTSETKDLWISLS